MERPIINPALSLLITHLVISEHQKAPNFSVFRWSPYDTLVSIGQHFVTMTVVHLPKRTETSFGRIGPKQTLPPNRTRLCGPCIAAIAGFTLTQGQKLMHHRQNLCTKQIGYC